MEFHGFVHWFCRKMLSLLKSTLMYHSCIGKIFCVREAEIQLVGQNKQHCIRIERTLHIIVKILKAPRGGANILFQACFSAPGPGQLWTMEGKMNSPACRKIHLFCEIILPVHLKVWVLQQDKAFMVAFSYDTNLKDFLLWYIRHIYCTSDLI